jgi:signal transduction histidine kinase
LVLVTRPATDEAGIRGRLREHNRALAELVATKTELVSALLHELRTPLASALAMVDLLPESTGDPFLDEALPMITRKVRRIGEVVEEIATISGIETGAIPLAAETFDLLELLQNPGPGRAVITGDREWLATVFRRLAAAVRAVGGSGEPITTEADGDTWRIALRLPDRQATDRLFTSTAEGGNATALMVARAVVGRHGGHVGVESVDGTPYLTVRLPR